MTKKQLIHLLMEKGITRCEAKLSGCKDYMFLTLAHKEKRWYYKTRPELLWDYSNCILMCQSCHERSEYDRELNYELFRRLR